MDNSLLREDGPSGNGKIKKTNIKLHLIAWAILAFIVGIEFTYNQALIEWSIDAMRAIQENKTPGGVKFF